MKGPQGVKGDVMVNDGGDGCACGAPTDPDVQHGWMACVDSSGVIERTDEELDALEAAHPEDEHICSAPGYEPCRNPGHAAWLMVTGQR